MSNDYSLTDMDGESQRTIAVWTVFVFPFLILGGFLYIQEELTIEFIGLYWVAPILVTAIGVIKPPWDPLVN